MGILTTGSSAFFNPSPGAGGYFAQNGIQLYHTNPVVNRRAALFELRIVVPTTTTQQKSVGATGTAFTPQQLAAMFPYNNGNVPSASNISPSALNLTNKTVSTKKTVNAVVNRFIFPISPTGLRKSVDQLNTPYMVAGSAFNFSNPGTEREMDMFGQTPPIWIIEGTTGWKYHSNDGLQTDGITAFQNLQLIFNQFNYLVQNQARNQSKIQYELELYDYFNRDYWIVAPSGSYVFEMDASRPLIGNYRLELLGMRPVSNPPKPLVLKSALAQRISSTISNAANTVTGFASSVSNAAGEIGNIV